MATGVGMGFDLSGLDKKLKQADTQLNQLMQKMNTLSQTSVDAFKKIATQGVEPVIDDLVRQRRELEALSKIKGGGGMTEIKREARASIKEIDKVIKLLQRASQKQGNPQIAIQDLGTPKGALEYARGLSSGVKSINTMNLALQRLRKAQADLNTNTSDGRKKYREIQKEIEKIEKELGKVHTKQSSLLDTSGQLARALAAAFSVSAIKGYVNKLMQIRGEFELQQRSLQVLLQNKAEANELWDKTVALAVKSPLTTKQLVTSTKQLAAYRIENEKLYETNKMLADVSQGLGVDMNRLILAFGQVKAANFLRGTELRQFSEAGVNMLEELAKRFTEIEGRAISVGEVFERVSKRMVTFEDVEAVFKNITSKGGTFYQMQEKQSKTLRGMMLNLKDSYELMLNEIGEEREGMLKGVVNLMRELVRSWRELAPLIETAGLTFFAYFSFSKIAQLVTWFGNLATAIKSVGAASAMATKINPWVALATVVAGVAITVYEMCTAVSEFEAISISVNKEVTEIFSEQVALYKELADKFNDATTSETERKEVLGELQQKYKDILPDMYTELKYIEAHAGNYRAAEEAMRSYYNSMAIERKKSKIMASHEESLYQTDIPELALQWQQEISDMSNLSKLEKEKLNAVIPNIIAKAVEAFISGAEHDWAKGISDRATKYIGKEIGLNAFEEYGTYQGWFDQFNLFNHQMMDMHVELLSLKHELRSVSGLAFGTMEDEINKNEVDVIKKRIKEVEDAYKTLSGVYSQFSKEKINEKEVEEKIKAPIKVLEDAFGKDEAEKINSNLKNISGSIYDFTVGLNDVTIGFYNQLSNFAEKRPSLSSNLQKSAKYNPLVEVLSQTLKDTEKEYGNIQKEVLNVFEAVRQNFDLSSSDMNVFASLFPDDSKTLSDVRTNLSGKIEQLTSDIKLYNKAVEAGNPNENPLGFKDKDVKKWKQQVEWLQLALDMLGGDNKKQNEQLEKLKKQIQLVTQLADDYEKLRKEFGADTAEERVYTKERADAFSKLGLNLKEFSVGAPKDEIKNLKKLEPIAENIKGGWLQVLVAITKAQNEIDSFEQELENKDFERYFKDLFGDYELTLEMEKLNIPRDLASKLFGFNAIDLSEIRDKTLEMYGLGGMKGDTNQDVFDSAEYKRLSDPQRKQIEDNLKKINDLQDKMLIQYGKKYSKYLLQAQSERVKIKLDEIRQLEDIEQLYLNNRIDAEMKERMELGIKEQSQKALDKQVWKDFQDSDMYVRLFDNLEGASMRSIERMRTYLTNLRDSLKELDPTSLKTINDQIEKLDKIAISKKPLKGMASDAKTYFEYLKKRKDLEASYDASVIQENAIKSNIDALQINIDLQEKELATKERLLGKENETVVELREKLHLNKLELDVLLKQLVAQKKRTKEQSGEIRNGQDAGKNLSSRLNETASQIDAVVNSANQMAKNLEAAFGMSDSMKDTFEAIQGVGSGISEMTAGIAGLASQDPVQMFQGAMQLVGGFSRIVASFNEAHDKKKERQIQREIKLVERLDELYEKLGKQIEQAYSINTLKYANDAANKNLEQQYKSYEDMIAAEEDKKKTDHERIEEWRKVQEEILEKQEELERDRLQSLGGVGDETNYKDAAQSFVDAWLEAFKETGNGIEALDEEFNSMLENIVKRQLLLRATDSFLAPIFNEIDKAVADTEVTTKEMNDIKELAGKTLPELDKFLEELANDMGLSDLAGSTSELSGLSAGIQGMSAEQADILAAYWSSSRFLLSTIDNNVRTITENLGINAEVENPMLPHLRTIAEQTAAINSLLNSLTAPHPTQSGRGLKVII